MYTNNYNPQDFCNNGGQTPYIVPPPPIYNHPPPSIVPPPFVADLSQPPPQLFTQPPPSLYIPPAAPLATQRKSRWDKSLLTSASDRIDTALTDSSEGRRRKRDGGSRLASRSRSRSSHRRKNSCDAMDRRSRSKRCRGLNRSKSLSPKRMKLRRNVSPSYKPRSVSSSKPTASSICLPKHTVEHTEILKKWQDIFYASEDQVSQKIMDMYVEKSQKDKNGVDVADTEIETEKQIWTRSTPAELYYYKKAVLEKKDGVLTAGSELLNVLCDHFKETLVMRAAKANESKPKYDPPPRKNRARICKHKTEQGGTTDSSTDEDLTDEEDCTMEELTRKQQHPYRLHSEMWYNDPGEMNDGPLCRCSNKSRKSGIRHGIYPGEEFLQICDKNTNNANILYHYRVTISPPTNFLIKTPTIIQHDQHEFIFEGFSMFSHKPLVKLPTCKVIRFNIEYTILYIKETVPENFTIRELDLFHDYLFREILELVDLDFKAFGDDAGCSQFHFMPRFVRELKPNGKEILSMNVVLEYLIKSSGPLIREDQLEDMVAMEQYDWQVYADEIKGMVVTYPGKKPCSVRVDQLDRNVDLQKPGDYKYPEIVHFGIRPPQLSYAGNPEYQKAWRDYVKFRHLLANMSKPTYEDKRKLEAKESKLQEMRTQSKMKRDVTIAVSAEGFFRSGIMCDVIQHAMLVPVLVCHLRFHNSLDILESELQYKFHNRALLQLALTHPSYRENFGTNPDHARNSLTNCGIRQPEYGDRRIHYMNTRKRGINTLINIMSRFGSKKVTESRITHNERLEFLGDAVVEFLSSIHLFHIFPELEEGGLATYRAAIVQNQHLAVLARVLQLDRYMLYAHGSDLCHDLELRHAMANCYEALMGALFLDGGIDVVDRVFSHTLFQGRGDLLDVWVNYPPHPLQQQEPSGDRHWIDRFELLKKLTQFEASIGQEFNHIRLLARAFTDRSVGYTNLTLGSNQRLEFLGDTVLQLIASEYLYKHFPEHHEGHLSLLRSSLVNNRTQAVVCDDLGMSKYAVYNNPKADLKTKDRADLLEAFIGALFVDRGLTYCEGFAEVTLFPRLQDFIMNQDWNDPKSKLQQCCLTLRTMDGGEPDIPVYKVIECKGPTNTRVYTVAVYFRGRRLASAMGHSIQQAEMNAAKEALEQSQDLFPQLDHQKRVIAKSMKRQQPQSGANNNRSSSCNRDRYYSRNRSSFNRRETRKTQLIEISSKALENDKNLPSSYRRSGSNTPSTKQEHAPLQQTDTNDRRSITPCPSSQQNDHSPSCGSSTKKMKTKRQSMSPKGQTLESLIRSTCKESNDRRSKFSMERQGRSLRRSTSQQKKDTRVSRRSPSLAQSKDRSPAVQQKGRVVSPRKRDRSPERRSPVKRRHSRSLSPRRDQSRSPSRQRYRSTSSKSTSQQKHTQEIRHVIHKHQNHLEPQKGGGSSPTRTRDKSYDRAARESSASPRGYQRINIDVSAPHMKDNSTLYQRNENRQSYDRGSDCISGEINNRESQQYILRDERGESTSKNVKRKTGCPSHKGGGSPSLGRKFIKEFEQREPRFSSPPKETSRYLGTEPNNSTKEMDYQCDQKYATPSEFRSQSPFSHHQENGTYRSQFIISPSVSHPRRSTSRQSEERDRTPSRRSPPRQSSPRLSTSLVHQGDTHISITGRCASRQGSPRLSTSSYRDGDRPRSHQNDVNRSASRQSSPRLSTSSYRQDARARHQSVISRSPSRERSHLKSAASYREEKASKSGSFSHFRDERKRSDRSMEAPHPFTTRPKSPSSYSRNRFKRKRSASSSD